MLKGFFPVFFPHLRDGLDKISVPESPGVKVQGEKIKLS